MAKYSVSYVYQIVDKYSSTLDKMKRKTEDFATKTVPKMSRSFEKASASMRSFGSKGALFVSAPLALLGKSMISAASDAEETRSKFATIFKGMGTEAEMTADKFAKNFGLAGSSARKFLGDTSDLLTGFGFTQKAALDLSVQVNELAVDLASFTNFSGGAEGASKALTNALLGQREGVKSLGIAILEEGVKKKIAVMRSQGMRFATEREEKAYATLQIALSQSKNAIGDAERTKKSYANVTRRVSQRLLELRESFGKLLIPIATKFLLVIEKVIESFNGLDDNTKKIILSVLSLVAVAFPLLTALGSIALIAPIIAKGFAIVASAFAVAKIALIAFTGPIGATIATVSMLVAAIVTLYKKSARFRDIVTSPIRKAKDLFGFGEDEIKLDKNVAVDGNVNNKLNIEGMIGIKADNAKVTDATLSSSMGNLGFNLAGAI